MRLIEALDGAEVSFLASMRWRSAPRGFVLVLGLSGCGIVAPAPPTARLIADANRFPAINLEADTSMAWLVDDHVVGVFVGADGSLGYWSDTAVYTRQEDGTAARQCGSDDIRPRAAAFSPSGHVEIHDAGSHRVLQATGAYGCVEIASLDSTVLAAARDRTGWVLLSRRSGRHVLTRLHRREGLKTLAVLPRWFGKGSPAARIAIEAEMMLVSQNSPPFATAVYTSSGRLLLQFAPYLASGLDTRDGSVPFERWTSTGVFRLDSLYLQVIADLGTDRRALILLDGTGGTVRVGVVEAPFGFAAAEAKRNEIIGVRRTRIAGIVPYRWSWQATQSHLTKGEAR